MVETGPDGTDPRAATSEHEPGREVVEIHDAGCVTVIVPPNVMPPW